MKIPVIRRLWDAIFRDPDSPSGANGNGIPEPPLTSGPDPVCNRLERESVGRQPEIRRLFQEAFSDNCRKLNDELVCLMFNLTPPAEGFLDQWLVQALAGRSSLKVHRSVFYVYVDRGFRSPTVRELSRLFGERVVELAREAAPLRELLDARFRSFRRSNDPFDLSDQRHRDRVRNILGYNFSLCRKHFPERLQKRIYVVGKLPLHDTRSITQYQQELAAEQAADVEVLGVGAAARNEATVYLAARVLAEGEREGSRVRLNAHRFDDFYGPLRETELCVGTWLSEWEFSVGSAEHDEIRCAAFGEQSCKVLLNDLKPEAVAWDYGQRYDPPGLIPGLKCYITRETDSARNHVRVKVLKYGSLSTRLLDRISRQSFRQEIKLMGRLLPLTGGPLEEFSSANEGLRRAPGGALSPLAVIQLRPDVWLVRNADDTARCVYRRNQGAWEQKTMAEGERFPLDGFTYIWNRASDDLYPTKFFGQLIITPPDQQLGAFNQQLAADEDADGLLIAFDETFPRDINPDTMLGRGGVVSIKCHHVRDDGRGQYVFMPTENPINPFFALRPNGLSKTWPSGSNRWLAFDGDSSLSDLVKDKKGQAVYQGKLIVADEYSFNLMCGTSVFQLKVSGTPQANGVLAAGQARHVALPASVAPEPDAPLTLPEPLAEPALALSVDDIRMRLLGTRWQDYEVNRLDQSNFALHCSMTKGDERYFLKAYFAGSAESARREAAFYEAYAGRASELFIESPDILRDEADGPPWGLVFRRLVPLHEWPPASNRIHLAHAAAIGYGFSRMLRALAADNLINFDVDQTMLCFTESGRMVIVDFDNVYPLLNDPNDPRALAALRGIWTGGVLPAKNPCLPPEAADFNRLSSNFDRQQALARVGPPFGTYMLAVMLLQLLKADRLDGRGLVTVTEEGLVPRAEARGKGAPAASSLEHLLREMLDPDPDKRPTPNALVERLTEVVGAFAAAGAVPRREVTRLLDAVP